MRSLKVLPSQPAVSAPPVAPYLATAAPVRFGEGFYAEQLAEGLPVRWMAQEAALELDPESRPRFLELWLHGHFHDGSQRLTVAVDGGAAVHHGLVHGWDRLSLVLAPGVSRVRLSVDKPFPREYYPGDGRALAVQVRTASVHADPARHGHITRQHANSRANLDELLAGRVELASTPPKLGIDIQGACNVKPPCVYCAWDFSKEQEGANVDVAFTRETLDEWGDLFENSQELVNCSIGEPFMGKNMDELLDAFGDRGKLLEMSTNGQILTDGNIARLLGRNVHLYISLDAATAPTYARLRNTRWELLLQNIRRLVAAKGGPGHLPLIYLVFMPMKANLHEVDDFVRLCAELRIDRLALRPLNDLAGLDLKWERAGYTFDYAQEVLPWPTLVRISGRVAELCERLGVALSDQLDFGGSMESQFKDLYEEGRREGARLFEGRPAAAAAEGLGERAAPVAATPLASTPAPADEPAALPTLGAERLPACTEPWKSLYILRRGIRPCCYGAAEIADTRDYRQAWNSPLMQGIRQKLLEGTFHSYCFDSPDCPIVKKAHEARSLTPREEALRLVRRTWDRFKRSGHPGRIYRAATDRWKTLRG